MKLESPIIPHTDIWETKVDPRSSLLIPHLRWTCDKCSVYHRDVLALIGWFGSDDDCRVVAAGSEESKVAYEVW